ncbi:hypothetical protein [Aurantibacter sp.]|uniref:hypothetical protein n=1 Tax=Aurantibacter sp. TaxID=2807103 RepID=UPI003263F50E
MAFSLPKDSLSLLKSGIWLYLILLLFEGALRKWILPNLAGPLALIRDPLVLLLLYLALKKGFLKVNGYLILAIVLGIIAMGTTFLFGHGNVAVCIYGARIILLYFPLIFVIGNVFDKGDLLKIGNALLYIAIPMTVLMILQFYSPQSAWVNRGIGGDLGGAGFPGALGYYRPPGTFSFISGLTQFYGLLTTFIFYFWLNHKLVNRTVLILATIGLVAAIPFSISRTLLYQTIIALLFMLFAIGRNSKYLPRILLGGIGAVLIFLALSSTSLLKTPIEAFTSRFEGATKYEGGVSGTLVDRYLGGMLNSFSYTSESHFFGHGLGIGTNAGGKLMTGEKTMLIYAEDEWARLIGESGLLIGLALIFIRVVLGLHLAFSSLKALKQNNLLPWLLLSFCLLLLPNGQWGQPTTLGFSIFVTGLLIASFKDTKNSTL